MTRAELPAACLPARTADLGPVAYANLRADMFRLWLHFGGLDARSMNPLVQSLAQQEADGAADGEHSKDGGRRGRQREQRAAQITALRGALARCGGCHWHLRPHSLECHVSARPARLLYGAV
jgi:hypothetical protein